MNGNFSYYNPTKLYFGPDALNYLKAELSNYGPVVLLNYGGGSVCDYSKAVSAAVHFEGDYWDAFYLKQQNPPQGQRLIPVGCILTMAGTGSEMNAGTVITDAEHTFKVGHVFDNRLMPAFSIMNPNYTMTVPDEQMKAGIYDIMSHIMEQYFSGDDDNTSDYMADGLPKFKRFAQNVWGISSEGKTDEQVAKEGFEALKSWMVEIGLPLTISEIGATEDMIEGIAKGTIILSGGYRALSHKEVIEILKESM